MRSNKTSDNQPTGVLGRVVPTCISNIELDLYPRCWATKCQLCKKAQSQAKWLFPAKADHGKTGPWRPSVGHIS